jgi:hypothetical protein
MVDRDDCGDSAAVAFNDDVFAVLSVLDQAGDAAAGGRSDRQGPLSVDVGEDGHA